MKQREIFLAFFKSSILGFGGGPAAIPLIKKEVVHTYELMSEEEFYETMAIGNTLPGPIITKLAGYIGYRVGGLWGLLNATIASVVPSVVMMVLLFKILNNYKEVGFVQGMTNGVIPIIAVMMLGVFIDLMKKTKKSLGIVRGAFILAIAAVCMLVFNIHSGIVVGITIVLAIFLPVSRGDKE